LYVGLVIPEVDDAVKVTFVPGQIDPDALELVLTDCACKVHALIKINRVNRFFI
jgi:hypothetical protein